MAVPDRREVVETDGSITGIDYVLVAEQQDELEVHFLGALNSIQPPLVGDLLEGRVHIDGSPSVRVRQGSVSWSGDILKVGIDGKAGYSPYTLRIEHRCIDPYFNELPFSFKVNCPSELDCRAREESCPREPQPDVRIDYRGRDYRALRRALLEFASLRYPEWEDRQFEADVGVMFTEVLAALGDEMAYTQDRIAREASLETATQRRSLRRHARLVDYEIHDGFGASTWLDVIVAADGSIPAGTAVHAEGADGRLIVFEVGSGLSEMVTEPRKHYPVLATRNRFEPHIWDKDDRCLKAGATELYIKGKHKADLPLDQKRTGTERDGRWVLLQTKPNDRSIPERTWMVWLIAVEESRNGKSLKDPLQNNPATSQPPCPLTRLVWGEEHATPFGIDLESVEVHGNLIPATAGRTFSETFYVSLRDPDAKVKRAVERTGPDGSAAYLFSLSSDAGTDGGELLNYGSAFTRSDGALVWRDLNGCGLPASVPADPRRARPEICLVEVCGGGATELIWDWKPSFLSAPASLPHDTHYVLDDGTLAPVVTYRGSGTEWTFSDYKRDSGKTIRFGDGRFGRVPSPGTEFKVYFRLGNGRAGNVAAGTLNRFDPEVGNILAFVESVTNPLAASNGIDAETPVSARQLAPEAYRAETYRAVIPRDYGAAAERLQWVQRAGAQLRWTGSWLSMFVTPDPKGTTVVSAVQRQDLMDQLDRYRQAGRPVHASEPRYADIHLEITVCVEPTAYGGEVKERILNTLLGRRGPRPQTAFFSPDRFTFGTPLARSDLEAAIQQVEGVRAVGQMMISRRGHFDSRPFTELVYPVAQNEVIRLENDPDAPDHGTLALSVWGGA